MFVCVCLCTTVPCSLCKATVLSGCAQNLANGIRIRYPTDGHMGWMVSEHRLSPRARALHGREFRTSWRQAQVIERRIRM